MSRRTDLVAVAAVLVFSIPSTASADPIVLMPTAVGEIVAEAAGLRLVPGAQNVALGPSAETRVFYEFALAGVTMTRGELARFSVARTQPFSECAALNPCPELQRIDIFGFSGNGEVTLADYAAGTLLGSVAAIPTEGHRFTFDVTSFMSGLLSQDQPFAGIALRPGSQGGAGFSDARLTVVPEPSTLALAASAAVGLLGRQYRRRRHSSRA